MQIVTKNEAEGLRKTLEMRTKERDMYKDDAEKYKVDNNRLRGHMKDLILESNMLKKQLMEVGNQDEDAPVDRQEQVKAEVEHQVSLIKQQFAQAQREDRLRIQKLEKEK